MKVLLATSIFVTLAVMTSPSSGEPGYFGLRHIELRELSINTEGGTVAAGSALVTDKSNALSFYLDGNSRLRTHNGDYCVAKQAGDYVGLATCSANGGPYFIYIPGDSFYANIQLENNAGVFATWEDQAKAVAGGGRLVARTTSQATSQDQFGAGWQRKEL
jgi:hypothetical protein